MFDKAVKFVLKHEGGWSADVADRGGATRFGISERAFPGIQISTLTLDNAINLYREHYWDKMLLDQTTPMLSFVIFDSAVNCGRSRTTKWVQGSCNHLVCGKAPLKIDGIMGPKTIKATKFCPEFRLAALLIYQRQLHYLALRAKYPQYLAGWIGRTTDLLCEIGGMKECTK